MGPLGDGGLQCLLRPWGPRVVWDALLYIYPEESHGRMLHPLRQASQCIPLIASEERQTVGCLKDFPGRGLSRIRQVIRR